MRRVNSPAEMTTQAEPNKLQQDWLELHTAVIVCRLDPHQVQLNPRPDFHSTLHARKAESDPIKGMSASCWEYLTYAATGIRNACRGSLNGVGG